MTSMNSDVNNREDWWQYCPLLEELRDFDGLNT